ncbi:limonene-1,2-epoxide hydrolase family protein [Phenylobacterium aquaticum]|uniref:nuclear transport factor 2 family protein n=1 Tax=Phenylobacterium aquaticum TaxID=1763816 RepID=UPI0026F24895|nr:limonene-1,2-epoxide hydrolase family protein [Phenylobacterium aquaticum]
MKRFVGALALALTLATAAVPAHAADTDASRIAVAKDMIAAWKNADWKHAADLFAENGVLHSMMAEPVVGRAAVYERIAGLGKGAPAGVVLDVTHMGVIDGLVYMERTDRFVYNGHAGAVPVVGVLDIRDGKVQEWREYYDRAELLKEMGVGPK